MTDNNTQLQSEYAEVIQKLVAKAAFASYPTDEIKLSAVEVSGIFSMFVALSNRITAVEEILIKAGVGER